MSEAINRTICMTRFLVARLRDILLGPETFRKKKKPMIVYRRTYNRYYVNPGHKMMCYKTRRALKVLILSRDRLETRSASENHWELCPVRARLCPTLRSAKPPLPEPLASSSGGSAEGFHGPADSFYSHYRSPSARTRPSRATCH